MRHIRDIVFLGIRTLKSPFEERHRDRFACDPSALRSCCRVTRPPCRPVRVVRKLVHPDRSGPVRPSCRPVPGMLRHRQAVPVSRRPRPSPAVDPDRRRTADRGLHRARARIVPVVSQRVRRDADAMSGPSRMLRQLLRTGLTRFTPRAHCHGHGPRAAAPPTEAIAISHQTNTQRYVMMLVCLVPAVTTTPPYFPRHRRCRYRPGRRRIPFCRRWHPATTAAARLPSRLHRIRCCVSGSKSFRLASPTVRKRWCIFRQAGPCSTSSVLGRPSRRPSRRSPENWRRRRGGCSGHAAAPADPSRPVPSRRLPQHGRVPIRCVRPWLRMPSQGS